MRKIGPTRRRNGATSWRVFRDLGEEGLFVERYIIDSWAEYVRLRSRMTIADRQLQDEVDRFQRTRYADPRVAAAGRGSAGRGRTARAIEHQALTRRTPRSGTFQRRGSNARNLLAAWPERSAHSAIPALARYSCIVFERAVRIGHRNLARDLDIALAAGHHIHVDIVGLVAGPIGRRLDRAEAHEIGRAAARSELRRADSGLARRSTPAPREGARRSARGSRWRRAHCSAIRRRRAARRTRRIRICPRAAAPHPGAKPSQFWSAILSVSSDRPGCMRNRRRSPLASNVSAASSNCHTSYGASRGRKPQRSLDIGRRRAQADLDFRSRGRRAVRRERAATPASRPTRNATTRDSARDAVHQASSG